jgi:hypothetical protein
LPAPQRVLVACTKFFERLAFCSTEIGGASQLPQAEGSIFRREDISFVMQIIVETQFRNLSFAAASYYLLHETIEIDFL